MTAAIRFIKPYLLLFAILLIAYLPLSSLYFGMKNDAFSDNFPDKYFLSEALHAGIFPLWNPYMNFGFPMYADPGFAYWNPITWLFAGIGYSAYTLTVEVLLYLYIAGILMFNLGRHLKFSTGVSIVVAAMYMCSGFFIGSIQYINFLTAAAFLPFLLQSFLQCIRQPSLRYSAKLSVAFYFVSMGGHPAIPIASVYCMLILCVLICAYNFKQKKLMFKKIFLFLLISMLLFLLVASPMLYSYASVWKFYGRDTIQKHFEIGNIGFDLSSFSSFLFPFTTTAHSSVFTNDVAMRNIYFSLIGFISLFFAFYKRNKLAPAFFITAILMLVLSFGGHFKTVLFNYLPGLYYIRTNGEFRVLTILLLIVLSGFGIDNICRNSSLLVLFRKIIIAFALTCAVLIISVMFIYNKELINFFSVVKNAGYGLSQVKAFLNNENFAVAFIISLVIALVLCVPFIFSAEDTRGKIIVFIVIDLIINSVIYLPVTGIGNTSLSTIQSFYNANTEGIPVPELIPINKIDTLDTKTTGLIGDITYYNKKIGTTKLTDYPSYFASIDSFFKSRQKNTVLSKPYIFLKSGNQNFEIKKFTPQRIVIDVESMAPDSLIYLQNHYTYWEAFNNGKEVPVSKAHISFMSVSINKGINEIEFRYADTKLTWFVLLALITWLMILIILIKTRSHLKPAPLPFY